MPTVATYNQSGVKVGEIQLNDAVFGVEVNEAVMHQAVVRQLSNERLGTHATKTRGMVRGGGRKPWKQKGTCHRCFIGNRLHWHSFAVQFTHYSVPFYIPSKG